MAELSKIVSFLDQTLGVKKIQDHSLNGLQFEGTHDVKKVACAVDACVPSFRKAADQGAQLVLVHHGLLWSHRPIQPFKGGLKKALGVLFEDDLSVYAAHLPLDLHAKYGNNALLCCLLGLRKQRRWGEYDEVKLGYWGELPREEKVAAIARKLSLNLCASPKILAYGKQRAKKIGVVSGGGGYAVQEAVELGLDLLITGEIKQHEAVVARDEGLSVIAAGHYATETLGVKAAAGLLQEKFGVKIVFVDAPTGV
ncbi:Nif3-like dinuclear metal center hexameric protein [Candidatus Micrarchaeota archaeon]|nr:Nif3-like dinuclear metal center hexameric protein [Candidatus Micrarchaeota archaeon]